MTSDQSLINTQAPRTLLLHGWIEPEYCSCERIPKMHAQRIANADHNYTILHNDLLYLSRKVYLLGSSRGLLCFEEGCGCGLQRLFLWNPVRFTAMQIVIITKNHQ